ncbi:lmo0937 family membrane protein [Spirosoma koreense]
MERVLLLISVVLVLVWALGRLGLHSLNLGGCIVILLAILLVRAIGRLLQGHDL